MSKTEDRRDRCEMNASSHIPKDQPVIVRQFTEADVDDLVEFMRDLAAYEKYLADFKVTPTDIVKRGLGANPEFHILVAENKGVELVGMAVYYFVPYTYDLTPDLILKELFVNPAARGKGVGKLLMAALRAQALEKGCRRLKWLVMSGNELARAFYQSVGAAEDTKWENWSLNLDHDETNALPGEQAGAS